MLLVQLQLDIWTTNYRTERVVDEGHLVSTIVSSIQTLLYRHLLTLVILTQTNMVSQVCGLSEMMSGHVRIWPSLYTLDNWQHSDSSLYQLDVSYVFLFMMILCRLDVRILPWHPRIIWRHDGRRPQHAPPLPPPHTRYLWRQVPSFSNSDLWVWLWLWYADSHAS